MSQQITRSTTPNLFNQTIYKNFTSSFDAFPSELGKMFKETPSTNAFEYYQELGGFKKHELKAEGAKAELDSTVQGKRISIDNDAYSLAYEITHEAIQDNQHPKILRDILELGKSAAETREIVGTNFYNNGFTDLIYDGLPWFDTAHPLLKPGSNGESTSANTPTVGSSLSQASLTIDTDNMTKFLEPGGLKQMVNAQSIIVPVELRVRIQKLLESDLEADNSNNGINVFSRSRGFFPQGYIWSPYLTDPDAFFYRTNVDGAAYQVREKRRLMEDNLNRQMVQEVVSYMRFGFGIWNWRSSYGNQGS